MRIETSELSTGTNSLSCVGEATPMRAKIRLASVTVELEVPWWEADLSAFSRKDVEDDVSKWQDAQIEVWSLAS